MKAFLHSTRKRSTDAGKNCSLGVRDSFIYIIDYIITGQLFYEEIKPKFGEDIAKAIATTRLEKLNVNNKLYEIRRL